MRTKTEPVLLLSGKPMKKTDVYDLKAVSLSSWDFHNSPVMVREDIPPPPFFFPYPEKFCAQRRAPQVGKYKSDFDFDESIDFGDGNVEEKGAVKIGDDMKVGLTQLEIDKLGSLNPAVLALLMQETANKGTVSDKKKKKIKVNDFLSRVNDLVHVENITPVPEDIWDEWVFSDMNKLKFPDQRLDDVDDLLLNMTNTDLIKQGFYIEFGDPQVKNPMNENRILYEVRDRYFFEENFVGVEHDNYLAQDPKLGSIVVSIEKPRGNISHVKCFLRTKKNYDRLWIEASSSLSKSLKNARPELAAAKFFKAKADINERITEDLIDFEKKEVSPLLHYKIGVLYVKENQEENQMFANLAEEASDDWNEFLEFLGERITLLGFTKFRGGLDVKENTTGLESVYTEHKGYEMMFHVSTLLPSQENDLQRVERKRHLGNDVMMIIFKEGDDPFDPTCLTNQFNQAYFIIKKVPGYETTHYSMVVVTKAGVSAHLPRLPDPPIFEKGDIFRNTLLTKVINAERSALISPEFSARAKRTRSELLANIHSKYGSKK